MRITPHDRDALWQAFDPGRRPCAHGWVLRRRGLYYWIDCDRANEALRAAGWPSGVRREIETLWAAHPEPIGADEARRFIDAFQRPASPIDRIYNIIILI
jgi:hypothetical protein